MTDKINLLRLAAAATPLAVVVGFLGGADRWLYALIIFVVLDFGTGIAKAIITKALTSKTAFIGGLRKLLVFLVVGMGATLDALLFPDNPVLRSLAIAYYIATEGLSILENIGQCGVKYPDKLREVLAALKKNAEKKADNAENNEEDNKNG